MRRRRIPRARRALKWTLAVAAAACLACWGLSSAYVVGYTNWSGELGVNVALGQGALGGAFTDMGDLEDDLVSVLRRRPPRWHWKAAADVPLEWWPRLESEGGRLFMLIPSWMPTVAFVLPAAWLFWSERRARPGHCRCGYSLAGLADGAACPECGGKKGL